MPLKFGYPEDTFGFGTQPTRKTLAPWASLDPERDVPPVPVPNASPVNPIASPMPVTPTPLPPPMFMPADPQSGLERFAKAMGYAGAAMTDTVPFDLKVQQLKQDAQLKQITIQQGWQNYQESQEMMKGLMQQHEQAAVQQAYSYYPKILADITSFKRGDPKRVERANTWKKLVVGLHPGMEPLIDYAVDKAESVFAMNFVIRNNPEWQKQVELRGMENVLADPNLQAYTQSIGSDYLRYITAQSMSDPKFREALSSGNMTQELFMDMIKDTAFNPDYGDPVPPDVFQFITEFAQTEGGSKVLASMGITPSSVSLTGMMSMAKFKPLDRVRGAMILELQEKIDNGTATPQEELEFKRLIGLEAKHRESIEATKLMTTVMIGATKGLPGGPYKKAEDVIDAVKAGVVPREEGLAAIEEAQSEYAKTMPEARQQIIQTTPVERSKRDIYDREALKQGKLKLVQGEITPAQLASGKYIEFEKSEREELQKLTQARRQSNVLFDIASKLFTATNRAGILKQQAIEFDVRHGRGAAAHDVDWKTYIDELAAWSGTYARTLGTERGVMTDVDVNRWVATMPSSSDSKGTVKRKIEIFKKMMNYVVETNLAIMTGELDLIDEDAARKNKDTIQGYLGSLEHVHETGQASLEAGKELEERKSAGQKLREKMPKDK